MKLILSAVGLFVATLSLGLACGPRETFCYAENELCRDVVKSPPQSDASDGPDGKRYCFDNLGNPVECGD